MTIRLSSSTRATRLGGTRNVTQVNAITAINGSTITVRNPLMYDFSTGSPQVKFYYVGITKSSGIENITLNHAGFSGGTNTLIQYCDSCWVKGVESSAASGYHFIILGTLNMELRDSFIHDGGSGPNNSGFNFYGNYLYGANANAKIENNIFNKDFPAIELNNSSSGFYIGYNYEYGSPSQYGSNMVTWSFDDGHAPFNIMNLYEGNIGEMMGADNYFGGSGYGTVLRNYFTGYNPNYGVTGDAVWLDRLAYYYNVVGNVLGSTNQAPRRIPAAMLRPSTDSECQTWAIAVRRHGTGSRRPAVIPIPRSPPPCCAGAITTTSTRRRSSIRPKFPPASRCRRAKRSRTPTPIRARRAGGRRASLGRRSVPM